MNEYVVILKNGKEIALLADDSEMRSFSTFDYCVFYKDGRTIAKFNLDFMAAIIRGDKYDKYKK